MLTNIKLFCRQSLYNIAATLPLLVVSAASSHLYAGSIRVDSLTHEYRINAGEQQKGSFIITNTSNEAVEIEMKHHDYLPTVGGRTEQPEIGTNPKSNGKWITLSPHQTVIPARGKGKVDYVINVPKGTADGTFWSAFTLLPVVRKAEDSSKMALYQRTGYVVQVISRVGQTVPANVNITDLYGRKNPSNEQQEQFIMNLKNVSATDVPLASYIEIYSDEGELITRALGSRRRVYPGTEVTFTFNLEKSIASGNYSSLIVLDDGGDNYFGVQKQLVISSDGEHTFN